MRKFESVGVALQQDAISIEEAVKRFQYSCSCCSARGIRIDCDRCCIQTCHKLVVAAFSTAKEIEEERRTSTEDAGITVHEEVLEI